jgi:hypothetical protein
MSNSKANVPRQNADSRNATTDETINKVLRIEVLRSVVMTLVWHLAKEFNKCAATVA